MSSPPLLDDLANLPEPPPAGGLGADTQGARVKRVYGNLNRRFQEQATQRRAQQLQLPYFNLVGFPIDHTVLAFLTREQVLATQAVVFFKEGSLLRIGCLDPQNPSLQTLLVDLANKKYRHQLYLISRPSFDAAFVQFHKIIPSNLAARHEVTIRLEAEMAAKLQGLAQNTAILNSLSPSDLLNLIIGSAVVLAASDIHLEPEKSVVKIRIRVDGVLQDVVTLPLPIYRLLLSRIKLLASLKLNVVNAPQDGRFTVKLPEKNLDVRVSSLPAAFGETIVLRLLGVQEMGFDIQKLGLRGRALEVVYEQLNKPNGLVLTTGPTGSGKTTTLYAFLNHVNRPGIKIITIEDPVEYRLEGIVQTPIDRGAGLDFAKALRSILRQDPDIIMVGEIRDFETAETVCQSALTGHIVFSTLHTNDAAGAIPRMLDLGVRPVTLAPALGVLIAQRLVRLLCTNCKEPYRPTATEQERVRAALVRIPPAAKVAVPSKLTYFHSRGCAACHQLGYRGRIGVFEVFMADETIHKLVFSQASTVDIKKAAVAQGMLTMQQDGILKALEGVTDLAEVWRVTEE